MSHKTSWAEFCPGRNASRCFLDLSAPQKVSRCELVAVFSTVTTVMSAQASSLQIPFSTSEREMFITPFPIIFLQLKVSPWHLFPWQRHPYFTLLPSTVNLSGYENSSCVFSSPHLATLVFPGWPLKPSSWGPFPEELKWKEWLMIYFSSMLFSLLILTPDSVCCESEGTPS